MSQTPKTEVDVVAMPSLRTDGTPDQTPGFKVLHEGGEVKAASSFNEFRDKTQETVEVPEESAAAATTDETETKAPAKSSRSGSSSS
ncbi:hypothetical protein [Blastococcus sp. CCUG 61487]|uniref:hypothetical protein n=1 Tax=Blastococcus sp. CCUG 61487 TaxID=1840703 RepID=UPI0010C04EBA|nr:hypothetical protein [Blastococcus sp. CCUG 61487]TKJ24360.1 hypothetical protein A6V29_05015 [Blastococcus sp. CCUG 61487]